MSTFKTQLKDALTSAVSYFQDVGDPNAACVKAANEAGFSQDQADRLVETFNTARVICHYKAASDKTSPCSLADKEKVRGGLTSPDPAEKHAAAVVMGYDTADYGCYKQAEVDYVVHAVKMAEFTVVDEPLSRENADYLAVRRAEAVRDCVKSAEEEARGAYAMADMLAEKAASVVSRNVSIDNVHDKVARIVAAYAMDDRYAAGVEKMAEFLPAASDPDVSLLRKYAAMHVVDVSGLEDLVALVKESSDFVAEGAALEAYAAGMRGELSKQAQAADDLDGKSKDDLDMLLLKERIRHERRSAVRGDSASIPGIAAYRGGGSPGGGGSSGGKSQSGKVVSSPSSFIAFLAETARDYDDSGARQRIEKATESVNNLRRQLILQDLLVRDKILSQEDPNAVVAAFRSINQISPDTALNKEVLRSMLRGTVQSVALSPYDAKTLADIDKARRQAYDPDKDKGDGGRRNG